MLADTLALTLIHFLWQGVFIGMLLALALWFAPHTDDARRSAYRYTVAVLGLLLLLAAPVLTFCWQWLGDDTPMAGHAGDVNIAVLAVIDGVRGWHFSPVMLRGVLALWAAGVTWFALKMLLAWVALQYLQRTQVQATPQWVARELETLVEQMSILRPVRLIVSGVINTPMTTGWLRPIIILPSTLLVNMQFEQLRLLLAHELAHIRRHDYLTNIVQNMARILLFYHPAVHWVCRILDEERELCCDHMAVDCSGSRLQYAKALLSLQEQPHPMLVLAAASTCKHALLRRIQRILGVPTTPSNNDLGQRPWLCLSSLLVSLVVFLSAFSGIDNSRASTRVMPMGMERVSSSAAAPRAQFLLDELYHSAASFRYPVPRDARAPSYLQAERSPRGARASTQVDSSMDWSSTSSPADSNHADPDSLQRRHVQRQRLTQQLGQQARFKSLARQAVNSDDVAPRFLTDLAQIRAGSELSARALTAAADLTPASDTLPEPVYQVAPRLPVRMMGNETVVIVNLIYSIDPAGKPTDILVAADSDDYDGAFAEAAADALRKWQYPPVSEPLQQLRVKQSFVFMQALDSSRCVTGSRLCRRDNYHVEKLIINPNRG